MYHLVELVTGFSFRKKEHFQLKKEIVHDPLFLSVKSEKATKEDLSTAQDLLDTLRANRLECVGMAANMIGVRKRIIAFDDNGRYTLMFNPEIIKCSGEYDTSEGCLSLLGDARPCKRYQSIKVRYQNEKFQQLTKTYIGFTAQIIQHEIDHCNGVLI